MTDPAEYITGFTIQEQMDELIEYVDRRAAEVAADYFTNAVTVEEIDISDFTGYTSGTLRKYSIGTHIIVYNVANLQSSTAGVMQVDTLDSAVTDTFRESLGSNSAITGQLYIDSGTSNVYLRVTAAASPVNGSLMVVIP